MVLRLSLHHIPKIHTPKLDKPNLTLRSLMKASTETEGDKFGQRKQCRCDRLLSRWFPIPASGVLALVGSPPTHILVGVVIDTTSLPRPGEELWLFCLPLSVLGALL